RAQPNQDSSSPRSPRLKRKAASYSATAAHLLRKRTFRMSNLHSLAKQRQRKEQQRFNAVQDLTILAYEKLLITLTRSGNTINDQHREALMEMLGMYSFIAAGKETGRWAFDLSVG